MEATISPKGRFAWEGQTVEYVVKAKGVSELAKPNDGVEGVDVRVIETKQVADGVEARVAVKVASPVFY
jgi:hypothetical protein